MPANDVMDELTAVFASAEDARRAWALIEEQSICAVNALRISADRVLHVKSVQCDVERIAEALRSAGAVAIKYNERQRDSGWMGHHNERITGSALTPGEGDAEAGALDDRRS